MTADELRAKVAGMLVNRSAKIWLTKSMGHRLDFVWSVGPAQTTPEETLARHGRYYLVGQNVPADLKAEAVKVFEEFCASDEAKADLEASKGLRITRQE